MGICGGILVSCVWGRKDDGLGLGLDFHVA